MSNSTWTGILRIKDENITGSLGSMQNGMKKVGEAFKENFFQNLNSFSLLKKGIDMVLDSAEELVKESRELQSVSSRYDIPIEQLGKLRNVALQFGLGLNGLNGTFAALENNINRAIVRPGVGASIAFTKLGISQQEVSGYANNTGDAFNRLLPILRGVEDSALRAALAEDALGGGADAMIAVLKRGPEAMQAAEDAAYKYTDSMTASNAEIMNMFSDFGEALKPVGQLIASVFGILFGLIMACIPGLKMVFNMITQLFGGGVAIIGAALGTIVNKISWAIGKTTNSMNVFRSSEEKAKRAAELDAEQETSQKLIKKEFVKGLDKINDNTAFHKNIREFQKASDRVEQQFSSLGAQFGLEDDETGYNRKINEQSELIKTFKKQREERQKSAEIAKKDGKDTKEDYAAIAELSDKIKEAQNTRQDVVDVLATRSLKVTNANRADIKADMQVGPDKVAPVIKTNEKLIFEEQQLVKERQLALDAQNAAIPSYMRYLADSEMAMKREKVALEDLNRIKAKGSIFEKDFSKIAEYQNKHTAAVNATAQAQQTLADLIALTTDRSRLADRDRRNSAIIEHKQREMFGMKLRGVSAIDQQAIVFKNQVDVLKREQEKLQDLANNPLRKKEYLEGFGDEAVRLKDSIQKEMFTAAKELDTLMAMQFNFVSSSAAQKGMGGGIAMVNNPIKIAEQSRDYLKKIYEAMLDANGMSGTFEQVQKINIDKSGASIIPYGRDLKVEGSGR